MESLTTSHRYYIGLLSGLLLVFLITPFLGHGSYGSQLLNFALIITLLFCVLVIGHSKKMVFITSVLASPLILKSFGVLIGVDFEISQLTSALFGVAFIGHTIAAMLRDMFMTNRVDRSIIIGSVSLYFLLGLLWGFIYLVIEVLYPGSFQYSSNHLAAAKDHTPLLMYYSLVTLTTLGYGDITPISEPARAMATMQAITGQIYLTVLVARLVGMHIAQKD